MLSFHALVPLDLAVFHPAGLRELSRDDRYANFNMASMLSQKIMAWIQLTVLLVLLIRQCAARATLKETKRKYITANHILDRHDIVDAFGHVSIRNPEDKTTFIMAKGMASALISNDSDLAYYHIADASPVRPQDSGRERVEKFIHSELLKRFSGINCCVHAHTVAVIPFATSKIPFLPVYHMVGYLGDNVPLWDITQLYDSTDIQDNLVTQQKFGASLAEAFGGNGTFPQSVFVLMKQHGFTTCAATIEDAVYQAVYAKEAALAVMSQAMLQHAYYSPDTASNGGIEALGPKQVEDTRDLPTRFRQTPWELWTKQVEVDSLYTNNIF
ncbi:class II aldolase and Adducin N-terminal domain-containing protein [Camillea tinctor]|nr:class II aldolase and Adducin N-terminal domain-containing protein [Camillea tinctor]